MAKPQRSRSPKSKRSRAGRPAGAKTNKQAPVTGDKTRCPKCDSTEREAYFATVEHAVEGVRDEKPYTHVVWRRTRCRSCGQIRQDRFYENRPRQKARKTRALLKK